MTLAIMQEVADKYTPTKFKAKFSAVFETGSETGAPAADDEKEVPVEELSFTLAWDEEAKKMLEDVPSVFRQAAVSNT